jgi:hypothetical protein
MSKRMDGDKFARLHGLKQQEATQQEWLVTCDLMLRDLRETVKRGKAEMRKIKTMIAEVEMAVASGLIIIQTLRIRWRVEKEDEWQRRYMAVDERRRFYDQEYHALLDRVRAAIQ